MLQKAQLIQVFSACAEVVPAYEQYLQMRGGILRVHGGSSAPWDVIVQSYMYSPRARR